MGGDTDLERILHSEIIHCVYVHQLIIKVCAASEVKCVRHGQIYLCFDSYGKDKVDKLLEKVGEAKVF